MHNVETREPDKKLNTFIPKARARYTGDFHRFFMTLAAPYRKMARKTPEMEQLYDGIGALVSAEQIMAKAQTDQFTAKDYQELSVQVKKVSKVFNYILSRRGQVQAFGKRVTAAETATGLKVEEMNHAQTVIEAQIIRGDIGKSILGKFKEGMPEVYGTGKAIISGLTTAALGPFAGMARLAGSAATGMYKDVRGKIIAAQQTRVAEAVRNRAAGIGAGSRETVSGAFGIGPEKARVAPDTTGERSVPTPEEAGPAGRQRNARERAAASASAKMTGSSASVGAIVAGMTAFFNKEAYQARWTHELLDILKKGPAGGFGGGIGGKGGILGAAGTALATAGKFLANPTVGLIAGLGMGAMDVVKAQKVAQDKDWFKTGGKPLTGRQKWAAGIGGALGGVGPGIGEKGSTWADVAKNTLWGTGKGALIGRGIGQFAGPAGQLIGALIGGGVGTIGGLLGGRRIAQGMAGMQNAWDWITGKAVPATKKQGQSVNDIMAQAGIKQKLQPVPIGNDTRALMESNKKGMSELKQSMDNLSEAYRKSQQGGTPITPERTQTTDVYNNRDPLVDLLNSGNLEVS